MFLLRLQVNQFQKLMMEAGFNLPEFTFSNVEDSFTVDHPDTSSKFSVRTQNSSSHPISCKYSPDLSSPNAPRRNGGVSLKDWEETVQFFKRWLPWAKEEIEAVDL